MNLIRPTKKISLRTATKSFRGIHIGLQQCTLQEIIYNLPDSLLMPPSAGEISISHIAEDSRSVTTNTLFIATLRDTLDGHIFVRRAVAKGAVAVVISAERESEFSNIDIPRILVPNTNNAMQEIMSLYSDLFLETPSQHTVVSEIENQLESFLVDDLNIETNADYHPSTTVLPHLRKSPDGLREIPQTSTPLPMGQRGSHPTRAIKNLSMRSPILAAILFASFAVSLLCFYVTAYARVNAQGLQLSRLRQDLKLAERREIELKSEIIRYSLSAPRRAQAMGLMPVPPEMVEVLTDTK